jgi:hypothetical protein
MLTFQQGFLTPFAFGTSAQILLNLFKRFRGKSQNQILGKGSFALGLFLGSFGGLYKVRFPNGLQNPMNVFAMSMLSLRQDEDDLFDLYVARETLITAQCDSLSKTPLFCI